MLAFFLPLLVPTIAVLLETASFEALGQMDMDGVDSEAASLEPVTSQVRARLPRVLVSLL